MRLLLLLLAVVCVLTAAQDGGAVSSSQETRATAFLSSLRRTRGALPPEELCLSLRENEEQRQLLCNDRRSKFNYNPFGLRFGKRFDSVLYRRAVQSARTQKLPPLRLFSRDLEVPT